MRQLDLKVISQTLEWAKAGLPIWFCTVLSTYGSSPREPGAIFVATSDGSHVGSLSGGCVEEEFLSGLLRGSFSKPVQVVKYGDGAEESRRLELPCGGSLKILVEHPCTNEDLVTHLESIQASLVDQKALIREINLTTGEMSILPEQKGGGPAIVQGQDSVRVRIGPVLRIILAGFSPVAEACAGFAQALGYEVIACDPRVEVQGRYDFSGAVVKEIFPSEYISSGACHSATAILALTHDPRIDDLAMMEAVYTPAFYIGVMGSTATSVKREKRLRSIGGLDDAQIARLHMPIGLNIGSKTPAEIALSVMADVIRVYRSRSRNEL